MALDVAARFQDGHLRALAHDYLAQSERVAAEAQRIALALGKRRASVYYTAGLLSRIGELAVLKVMDQHVRQGHAVTEEEARIGLQDWAQPYGNKLKVQWHLPLELRQMIGSVHYLPRENLTQDRIIMRAAGLLADEGEPVDECRRLLRLLGLEEWLGDRGTGAGTQND
jgi:HD-like signal output (HDOD) protein